MLNWALGPAAYSAAVATSQVISTKIPLTVAGTNVIRSAAVGIACIAYLAMSPVAPVLTKTPGWVLSLSIASGVIMFFASIAYISMCREIGVVATSVATTAFSFFFTALAGFAMGEAVTLKTVAAMGIITTGIALHKAPDCYFGFG